jgi:MFS family permease
VDSLSGLKMEPHLNITVASTAPTTDSEDRVTLYGWKALAGSLLGYAMDGFDLLILGFMLTAISGDLGLTSTQAGSLVTLTLIGAVAGGLIFGPMSDHFGRIRVLTWTILIFAAFTGLCALARSYWDLVACRILAGLGLGGEYGIGMSLAAEAWPASKRARVSSYVALGWQIGVLLAAWVTPLLLPAIGWRGMFAVGLLPALVAFSVRRTLDEPEIFIKQHAAERENSFRWLVKDGKTLGTSVGIAVLCSVQNFGYYGLMTWMPSYLAENLGFSLTKSSLWISVTILGMGVGLWVFGQLADRIGRKPMLIVFEVGAVIMVIVYSRVVEPRLLLFVGAIMGVFVNGMIGGYGALISEAYPTAARATAQNVLWNIGRAVGGLGPIVIGGLAAKYSFNAAIALLAAMYVCDIIATVFLIPELKGRRLELAGV